MRIVMLLAILATSACASPMGPLLSGLDRLDYGEAELEFLSRLKPQYEIGKPEAGLAEYLRSQGMEVTRTRAEVGNSVLAGQADRRIRAPFCPRVVHLLWRADNAGMITELDSTIDATDCF